MRNSQLITFLAISSLLMTGFHFLFWNLFSELPASFHNTAESLALLTSNQSSPILTTAKKILFVWFFNLVTAIFCGVFLVISGLHRASGNRRFSSVILAGLVFSSVSHSAEIFWAGQSLNAISDLLIFEGINWLILAVTGTIFMTVKSRNIFRN